MQIALLEFATTPAGHIAATVAAVLTTGIAFGRIIHRWHKRMDPSVHTWMDEVGHACVYLSFIAWFWVAISVKFAQ